MVVTLNIANYNVHHMLVDNGSLMNILFYNALLKMNIPLEQLEEMDASIMGFFGELVLVEGVIMLPVIVGQTFW